MTLPSSIACVDAAAEFRRSDPDSLGKPHAQCRPARDGCSETHRTAEQLMKDARGHEIKVGAAGLTDSMVR